MEYKNHSLSTLFATFYGGSARRFNMSQFTSLFSRFPQMNKKNMFRYMLPVLLIVVTVVVVRGAMSAKPTSTSTLGETTEKLDLGKPLATTDINREFSFPILDAKEKEVARFSYVLEDAELRDEIIAKGNRATAIAGRTFLLVNLKITNTTQQGLQINTRDYVRLFVNDKMADGDGLAANIHNDPVEVQAISTQYVRIGFAINKSDKNHTLQVGEIKGVKETIKLELQ